MIFRVRGGLLPRSQQSQTSTPAPYEHQLTSNHLSVAENSGFGSFRRSVFFLAHITSFHLRGRTVLTR